MLELEHSGYVRMPMDYTVIVDFNNGDYFHPNEKLQNSEARVNALRYKLHDDYYSYTVMLINASTKSTLATACIFQPEIKVSTDNNANLKFIDYAELNSLVEEDEDEKINALLYRNKKKYGTGLGTSATWMVDDNGKGYIASDFFPEVEVPTMDFSISSDYRVTDKAFSMKYLSDLTTSAKEEKIDALNSIVFAYGQWIKGLESELPGLPKRYIETASNNIQNCKDCFNRMERGLQVLRTNDKAFDAFQLANRAMYMQRIQVELQIRYGDVYPDNEKLSSELEGTDFYTTEDNCFWRPFQIAFLLMCVNAISDDSENNEDRNVVDLIWFPTGGGKTEAYLGLTAFTIFYRRLTHLSISSGTTVIMRYTLRLLAAQQFTRAATLICACEYIRRESRNRNSKYPKYELGEEEVSIGLWIGGEHTPNTLREAKDDYDRLSQSTKFTLKTTKTKYNKFQILKCPWCGTKMVRDLTKDGKNLIGMWGYKMPNKKKFYMNCTQDGCAFHDKLPIQVIDEDLYNNPPTLLFATVDKFAMLPWIRSTGNFFAANSENRSPELIIQDELHLISGPLGSLVGEYETAVDFLCSRKGIKPKIIASTATICHAKEQCSELYNRKVFQFPPQGLDESDSFFARAADVNDKFGRIYIGLLPAGKTKATMEGKVLAAIPQLVQIEKWPDEVKDCFWTLTVYFNSLKELGKCSDIIQNDVRDNILRMANRNFYVGGKRNILRPDELTSRVSTTELNETLETLEKVRFSSGEEKTYPSNILLATNMISVGIDVSRLNSMVMIGQPKLTSEYIQATSRVGRTYPGVVFTVYDGTRSRDRSHYEQFKSYHESFYRYVEPTGVTPFSEPARKRALHAVIISMLRHGFDMETDDDISHFDEDALKDDLKKITDFIVKRVDDINDRQTYQTDNESQSISEEIGYVFDTMNRLANNVSNHCVEYGNIMGNPPKEGRRLLKPFGVDEQDPYAFDTMTSMRNVDAGVNVNIIDLED